MLAIIYLFVSEGFGFYHVGHVANFCVVWSSKKVRFYACFEGRKKVLPALLQLQKFFPMLIPFLYIFCWFYSAFFKLNFVHDKSRHRNFD